MDDKKIYTYDDVVQWAHKAVEKMGDKFVYSTPVEASFCVYVHRVFNDDGSVKGFKPGCIVGHMLIDNTPVGLNELDSFRSLSTSGIRSLRSELSIDFTDKAMAFMEALQGKQDNQWPWGEALSYAEGLTTLSFDRNESVITCWVREYERETDPYS